MKAARPLPIGRDIEREECVAALKSAPGLALYGIPGQGKTELARYVATSYASNFADGVCEVDLQNEQKIENLPRLIATALGAPEATSSFDVLESKSIILVLDGLDLLLQASDLRFIGKTLDALLASLGERSRLIITSQQKLDKSGIISKKVRPLEAQYALALFRVHSSAAYEHSEVQELEEFVGEDLAGHPLSIKIVARYGSIVRIPVDDLRRLWHEKWADIAKVTPSLDDRTLLASFELSYATLPQTDRVWLLTLALLPDGLLPMQIKDIWPEFETQVYDCVRTLSDRAFLDDRIGPETIRLVGPLYRFANEQRSRASSRPDNPIFDRLNTLAGAIDDFIDGYVRLHAPQPTDIEPKKKSERISEQFHNIHASLDRRLEPSMEPSTLTAAGTVLLLYWAYHNNLSAVENPMASPVDAIRYLKRAHEVYTAHKRSEQAIRCQYYIGNILWLRGDVATARSYLDDVVSENAAPSIVCDAKRAFAHIEYKESSLEHAVELYKDVIELARSHSYADCIRRCYVGLLDAYRKLEQYEFGFSLFESEIAAEMPSYQKSIRGNVLRAHAYLLCADGKLEKAEDEYRKALAEFEGVSAFGQAHCRRGLGDVFVRLNQLSEAEAEFDTAIRLYDEAQKNPSLGVGLVGLGRGKILAARGDFAQAIAEYRKAADLFDRTKLNEPYEFAVAHELTGDAHARVGNRDQAKANYQIAVSKLAAMKAERVVARIQKQIEAISQ